MLKKVFPLLALVAFTLMARAASPRFTLVIDAGHGGNDHGAPGAFSKEKDLTLKYALALGQMVEANCPDVRVVYTRKTDVFIPLHERAGIANRNKADLFISIHINALDGIHTAHGFQSYTLGRGERTGDKGLRENLDVAKRENSVIFMEKDYKTVYRGFDASSAESDIMFEFIADKNRERSVELSRLMQREVCRATGRQDGGSHQNNLAVLRLTSMPSALLELGFISTPDEEEFLNSDAALPLYAKGMYNAFILYKNKYDDNITVPYRSSDADRSGQVVDVPAVLPAPARQAPSRPQPAPTSPRPAPVRAAVPASKPDEARPVFKIQILSCTAHLAPGDKRLKGLDGCECFEEGGVRKYTYGASNNYNEIYRLRKQILEKFPECFIIAFKNGKKMDVNQGIREFKANR
ncbi:MULTISPECIES: N-acetylmuramoyl-L-alanine amidase [Prevotellaceae]|uniref:N-acetylmuramoyl-L-alanine amidase n=1 Tax=Prevotella dentalis (strain ATCC 49559 / DSM 3688 / JCM 13448 / NCTC 12043 / ES 2772) TaxID=908937 RepID=F9D497_PREDD|nr:MULTISPECIES: N-acetylmuramoyl-L-alanine amidase [Prevotellaceae]AGB29939.1 N-acetylmuramoyl-L-alanine amidase [Prevotella dentalis DSM 3688]EGQ14140.1 N-acetylmuramoyl-L-alanine amidase [Prevotella dentalis DSM 3688]